MAHWNFAESQCGKGKSFYVPTENNLFLEGMFVGRGADQD